MNDIPLLYGINKTPHQTLGAHVQWTISLLITDGMGLWVGLCMG